MPELFNIRCIKSTYKLYGSTRNKVEINLLIDNPLVVDYYVFVVSAYTYKLAYLEAVYDVFESRRLWDVYNWIVYPKS